MLQLNSETCINKQIEEMKKSWNWVLNIGPVLTWKQHKQLDIQNQIIIIYYTLEPSLDPTIPWSILKNYLIQMSPSLDSTITDQSLDPNLIRFNPHLDSILIWSN